MATSRLNSDLTNTLKAALASNTHRVYSRIDKLLVQFNQFSGLSPFPADAAITALFIQYLAAQYKPSSIRTFIAGLSYKYKMANLNDPTNSFIVKQTLQGLDRLQPTQDTRLPITLPLLSRLLDITEDVCVSSFEAVLIRAILTTSFFGLLRISEFTVGNSNHTLKVKDVSYNSQDNSFTITLSSFKHSAKNPIRSIKLNSQLTKVCPVRHLGAYLNVRPETANPNLFIHENGLSVTRQEFTSILRVCTRAANISDQNIKSHSLRIGGATLAAKLGMSDSQIRNLGRWRSDAFKKYIRY